MHPLDAPAWGSLTSTHAAVSLGDDVARRYPPDVAIFAAYDPDTDGAGLAGVLESSSIGVLIGQAVPPRCGSAGFAGDAYQMVLDRCDAREMPEGFVVLGPPDHDEMAQLVKATEPGPWAPRTAQFGTYLGIRRHGALVAMAGERMRPPGYTEISAVCSDPAVRREGLASALCCELARRILARGETPFLHVNVHNSTALALYQRLGFAQRRVITFTAVRALPTGAAGQ